MFDITGNRLVDDQLNENHRISMALYPLRDHMRLMVLFTDYKRYINFTERSMKERASFLRNHAESNILSEAEAQAYSSTEQHFADIYPERFRSATLAQLFSIFENEYHKVCDVIQQVFEIDVAVSDLNDKGISRARKYIRKVSGMSDWDKEVWPQILAYQEIRNAKVHRNGLIANYHERIRKTPGVEWLAENIVQLGETFLPEFIKLLEGYLPVLRDTTIHTINTKFFKYLR
ncbi:hypothetical protein [Turneriella parva]|uniref:Cthe-2314-like HEPN domain-containing protein n=1 Tax=Turneriella parva (strain ATCC BAA-1111 / DSM 21527 / NCTC 11395 / H) TaxID=869212 RepID=I4B9S6_TURPD|nr:hypothetical protein [Turneriella parva]AFM14033.1 hypothetical protein Turpa_3395 [Turneriella parva DSM 21527]